MSAGCNLIGFLLVYIIAAYIKKREIDYNHMYSSPYELLKLNLIYLENK
jgi:hypothetical protein